MRSKIIGVVVMLAVIALTYYHKKGRLRDPETKNAICSREKLDSKGTFVSVIADNSSAVVYFSGDKKLITSKPLYSFNGDVSIPILDPGLQDKIERGGRAALRFSEPYFILTVPLRKIVFLKANGSETFRLLTNAQFKCLWEMISANKTFNSAKSGLDIFPNNEEDFMTELNRKVKMQASFPLKPTQ